MDIYGCISVRRNQGLTLVCITPGTEINNNGGMDIQIGAENIMLDVSRYWWGKVLYTLIVRFT